MNEKLRKALINCETEVDGAIHRFYGNEQLYISFLEAFLEESTMDDLGKALDNKEWEEAFLAAHALKGLAGNLGFVPLYHSLGELIVFLRSQNYQEAIERYLDAKQSYFYVISAIKANV